MNRLLFRLQKGHYGYLDRKRIRLMEQVGLIVFGIVILLVMGIISTGTRRNLLSVAAVLSVLPMANQLVVLIAVWKYRPREKTEYEELKKLVGNGLLNTELVITSKTDKAFRVDYAYVHTKGVFCYCSDKKLDAKKAAEYIEGFLEANDCPNDVFIAKDFSQYKIRLKGLEEEDRKTCDEKLLQMEGVLRAIAI